MSDGLTVSGPDRFGRQIAAFTTIITTPRVRRWVSGQRRYFHRPRNGAHDPMTQFHVLMAIMDLKPDERFTARELTLKLQISNDYFSWDAVTVGRILMDFIGAIELAYGTDTKSRPIIATRRWNGNGYYISSIPETREILARLADDLCDACDDVITEEARGRRVSRLSSPLGSLPSLHGVDLS